MAEPQNKQTVQLDQQRAKMLFQLLAQASATGPNAGTLHGLYTDVKAAAVQLGVEIPPGQ